MGRNSPCRGDPGNPFQPMTSTAPDVLRAATPQSICLGSLGAGGLGHPPSSPTLHQGGSGRAPQESQAMGTPSRP